MTRKGSSSLVLAFSLLLTLLLTSTLGFGQHYKVTDLTADMMSTAPAATNFDINLQNAWGLTRSSTSPWWVADNGTGLSTLYNAAGVPNAAIVVKIPTLDGTGTAAPTGTVFNFSTGFEVAPGKPAVFLFCTEDGTISGWNPTQDRANAILKFPANGKPANAVYKGCALAQTSQGVFLYATNFQTGRVDVFDSTFTLVRHEADDFRDHGPGENYAPFGIQNIGGNLVITFAKREKGSLDEEHGPGLGFVAVFSPSGRRLMSLEHGDFLDAPWGVALAPSDFGAFSHRLLIGNFGDGTVHAFNLFTGKHEGAMLNMDGSTLTIDGLWALEFGANSTNSGSATELYFTAGPNDEADGLFGKITVAVASESHGSDE